MKALSPWWMLLIPFFVLQAFDSPLAAGASFTVDELTIENVSKVAGPNLAGDIAGRLASGEAFRKLKAKVKAEAVQQLANSDYSAANGINDSGDVAGSANTSTSVHAFISSSNNVTRDLGTLPRDSASEAFGINNRGEVVGYSSGPSGTRAFLWTPTGGMQSLGTLSGGDFSKAFGINEVGAVVGTSGSLLGAHAVLWSSGRIQDLGALPGDISSEAFAVNNIGSVAGYSSGPAGMRAFVWTSQNGMQRLAPLPGGNLSRAYGINEKGDVVGVSASFNGTRAVLWDSTGNPQDLNVLLSGPAPVVLMEAIGINALGQILVRGRAVQDAHLGHHEGPNRAYLLTPNSP